MRDWRKARDEIWAYALKLSERRRKFDRVGKCFEDVFNRVQMTTKGEAMPEKTE